MKRISLILCAFLCILGFVSCKKPNPQTQIKHKIEYVLDEGINNVDNPTEFIEGKGVQLLNPTKEGYEFIGWFIGDEKVSSISKDQKSDVTVTAKWKLEVKPPVKETKVTISGPSQVLSEKTIQLTATVENATDQTVTWSITIGEEFATITSDGKLTAKKVTGDKIIEVTAKSNFDKEAINTKTITIISPSVLTDEMIQNLQEDKIAFEGYVNVKLYTLGLFEKFYSTYTYVTKTAMDGTNWYTEYEDGNTQVKKGLYFKNHDNLACQVGVSLMNEEQYEPMLDEAGHKVSWSDSGLYNNFKNLHVSDFTYNEETNRYDYTGSDKLMPEKMVASANPYDFIVNGFSLIISEDEIIGIYAQSDADYTIQTGYKAIQEMVVTINYGETVEVPTISKYIHDDVHDTLQTAIDNMRELNSYSLNFKEITTTAFSSGYTQKGFKEIIDESICYFDPYTISYDKDGNEIENYTDNDSYGYRKITNNLYNSYVQNSDGTFSATRAFEASLQKAKPTFEFAAEIFTSYYPDPKDGTTTYYVDDIMSNIATTLYYGVGNDINLYGIFATRGYTSQTESFTPYVVVKDGYIIEACFYFFIGSIYGVVELKYDDFNKAILPQGVDVNFETRNVPTSWSELTIQVTDSEGVTGEVTVNALACLQELFGDLDIDSKMPFFGNVLGDTYGFGMTTIHIPANSSSAKKSILLYYDVPLDIDYTITSSLNKVEEYLLELGFEKNQYGEFHKGKIYVAPVDIQLDLSIYVWEA